MDTTLVVVNLLLAVFLTAGVVVVIIMSTRGRNTSAPSTSPKWLSSDGLDPHKPGYHSIRMVSSADANSFEAVPADVLIAEALAKQRRAEAEEARARADEARENARAEEVLERVERRRHLHNQGNINLDEGIRVVQTHPVASPPQQ